VVQGKIHRWLTLVVFGFSLSSVAQAAPPVHELVGLMREASVRVAFQSEAGRTLLRTLGFADDQERLARWLIREGAGRGPRAQAVREFEAELRVRVLELQRRTRQLRARPGITAEEEGEWVLQQGNRLFALQDDAAVWLAALAKGETGRSGFRAQMSRPAGIFRTLEPDDAFAFLRRNEARVSTVTAAGSAEARWMSQWRELRARMQQCTAERSRSEAVRQRLGYWLGEVAIEATMTAGSAVSGQVLAQVLEQGSIRNVRMGTIDVSLDNLPNDLLTSAFATTFGTTALSLSNRYRVQWVAYTVYLVGVENTFDAVTYYVSPADRILQQDTSAPDFEDALAHYGVAAGFSLTNSWHEVGVFRWVDGLTCLAQGNARSLATLAGFRALYSFGGHLAYFALRYSVLDH
jgi:hypothetical protein